MIKFITNALSFILVALIFGIPTFILGIWVYSSYHTCPQPEPEIIYVQEKNVPLTDSTYMRIETRTQIIQTK